MSRSILTAGAHLTAFEIDPAYCQWLTEYLGSKNFRLIPGDVTKTWPTQWHHQKPDRVLGNLPYNAASAIIAAFIESDRLPGKCVFTVQDEMGLRITASPGTKDYSSFSVLCQTGAAVTDGGRLSPGSFFPAPRVRSRIIVMSPARPCGGIADADQFRLLVRSLFASRRKTLSNNIIAASRLKGFPEINAVKESFSAEGISLDRRPETVSPREWVSVSNRIAGS